MNDRITFVKIKQFNFFNHDVVELIHSKSTQTSVDGDDELLNQLLLLTKKYEIVE